MLGFTLFHPTYKLTVIIDKYQQWGISNQEVWEMLADIGQMIRTGKY
jgi:hypothetical protein